MPKLNKSIVSINDEDDDRWLEEMLLKNSAEISKIKIELRFNY